MIDFTPVLKDVAKTLWWIVPFMVVMGLLQSPWGKGVVGELLVKLAAKLRLPAASYRPIHNVTLPTTDGSTQIDHIFVSRFGIFVVETKNMRGWIFGGERQAQWTQKIFKESFKFQNPLHQNYKHVKTLESVLDVSPQFIHSVVVFTGDSVFKSPMPPNVTSGGGYIRFIKSFRKAVLSHEQVGTVVAQIQAARLEPSRATNLQHVGKLTARRASGNARNCPKCGDTMVLRTAKRGANAGKKFWGCSAFPRCRMVQQIADSSVGSGGRRFDT